MLSVHVIIYACCQAVQCLVKVIISSPPELSEQGLCHPTFRASEPPLSTYLSTNHLSISLGISLYIIPDRTYPVRCFQYIKHITDSVKTYLPRQTISVTDLPISVDYPVSGLSGYVGVKSPVCRLGAFATEKLILYSSREEE